MDIPKCVDLAVIVIKNTLVATVLEECGKKKVKGVIIITAGFKEVDEEGKKREQELKDIAKKYKIQIIGKFSNLTLTWVPRKENLAGKMLGS